MALVERTYLDLQLPERWQNWEDAFVWIDASTDGPVPSYAWCCATLNVDEVNSMKN